MSKKDWTHIRVSVQTRNELAKMARVKKVSMNGMLIKLMEDKKK